MIALRGQNPGHNHLHSGGLLRLKNTPRQYADSGIQTFESMEILKVDPLRGFGTPIEIVQLFGGKAAYRAAIRDLENALYAIAV